MASDLVVIKLGLPWFIDRYVTGSFPYATELKSKDRKKNDRMEERNEDRQEKDKHEERTGIKNL